MLGGAGCRRVSWRLGFHICEVDGSSPLRKVREGGNSDIPGPQLFLPSCGDEMKAVFSPVGYVLSGQELTADPGGTPESDSLPVKRTHLERGVRG